jgi:hypothetical protein
MAVELLVVELVVVVELIVVLRYQLGPLVAVKRETSAARSSVALMLSLHRHRNGSIVRSTASGRNATVHIVGFLRDTTYLLYSAECNRQKNNNGIGDRLLNERVRVREFARENNNS